MTNSAPSLDAVGHVLVDGDRSRHPLVDDPDRIGAVTESLTAAGCRQVWLNGSFVTTKEEPADFDACWDSEGVDVEALDPVLLDLSAGRGAQKARFGGELFPNVAELVSGLRFWSFSRTSATPVERESSSFG